jgi:DNA-binding NarL/FixJ family response regulator
MENPVIKILLVDDQTMYSESVQIALEMQPEINVTLAKNGFEAVRMAESLKPDIILMDISMEGMDGIDAAEEILKRDKKQKIIIVSTYSNRSFISKSLELGICGYVLKDEGVSALVTSITIVNNGGEYYSPMVTQIITGIYKDNELFEKNKLIGLFTPIEVEIFKHFAQRKPIKESAEILNLSTRQIGRYRQKIKSQLNIETSDEAETLALGANLFKKKDRKLSQPAHDPCASRGDLKKKEEIPDNTSMALR